MVGLAGTFCPTIVSVAFFKTNYDVVFFLIVIFVVRVVQFRVHQLGTSECKFLIEWRRNKGQCLCEDYADTDELIDLKREMRAEEVGAEYASLVARQDVAIEDAGENNDNQLLIAAPAIERPRWVLRGQLDVPKVKTSVDVGLGLLDGDVRNCRYSMQPLLLKAPHFSKWRFTITDKFKPTLVKHLSLTVVDELVSALQADGRQGLCEKTPEFFRQRAFSYAGLNIPFDRDSELRDASGVAAYWMTQRNDDRFRDMVTPPLEEPGYNWVPFIAVGFLRVALFYYGLDFGFLTLPLVVVGLCLEGALFSSF